MTELGFIFWLDGTWPVLQQQLAGVAELLEATRGVAVLGSQGFLVNLLWQEFGVVIDGP